MSQVEEAQALIAEGYPRWVHDPVRFAWETYIRDPRGEPFHLDRQQAKVLDALGRHNKVAVRSSHGIGKTTIAAMASHWWMTTRSPALVGTLAGTWGLLEQKLWPAINSWGARRRWTLHDFFDWQTMEFYRSDARNDVRALAGASDKPDNVEGWHSANLLIIIDEAKALEERFWNAVRGAMSTGEKLGGEVKVLVLSTPPITSYGWFVDLFGKRAAGWELIHISGLESDLVDPAWIADMLKDYGPESPEYKARVLGEIPGGSAISVLFTAWLEAAQKRLPRLEDRRPVVLTCDVAREGEDLTVLGRFQHAKFYFHRFADGTPAWKASNDIPQARDLCKRAILETGARMIVVDDTGVGGGVTDGLAELRRNKKIPERCQIVPVKFGASAKADERYTCRKDELWFAARDALRKGAIALPSDQEIATMQFPHGSVFREQMLAPIYDDQSSLSRVKVYDKRVGNAEKTKTLPRKSPDLAHAFILGVPYYLGQRPDETRPPAKTTVELFERQLRDEMDKRSRKKPERRPFAYRRGAW